MDLLSMVRTFILPVFLAILILGLSTVSTEAQTINLQAGTATGKAGDVVTIPFSFSGSSPTGLPT